MKKNIIKKSVVASLATILAFSSCNVPEDPEFQRFVPVEITNPETITQHIIANPELSLFERAIRTVNENTDNKILSDLNVAGSFTVFAPSDTAIRQFLVDSRSSDIANIPIERLTNLVLNHIVIGEQKISQLETGYFNTKVVKTFKFEGRGDNIEANTSLFLNNSGEVATVNRDANVITTDIDANNGVLHIIDKVVDAPNLASLMGVNPSLTTYLRLARLANDVVPGTEGFLRSARTNATIFLPTNNAFSTFFAESGVLGDNIEEQLLNISPDQALRIVTAHQVTNTFIADSLSSRSFNTRLDMSPINISVDSITNAISITDVKGGVSNVNLTDIHAINGVIHTIDRVLSPVEEEVEVVEE